MNSIPEVALLLVSCLFAQNFVLERLLGSSTLFEKTGTVGAAAFTGAFMAVVTTISSALNWLIWHYLLVPYKLESLHLMVFVLVLTAVAILVGTVMKKAGGSLGFLMIIVLMAGVQERLETSKIPAAMKGLPIALVSAPLVQQQRKKAFAEQMSAEAFFLYTGNCAGAEPKEASPVVQVY